MKDLTQNGTDGDTQTGRGQNRGITAAILTMASTIDLTGSLKKVLQSIANGTIVPPNNIGHDEAFAIFPPTTLIKHRLLLPGLGHNGKGVLLWHGDVEDSAEVLGNGVSIAELGISAMMIYSDEANIRISRSEAEALIEDDVFMNALESSSQISMAKCEHLKLPSNIAELSKTELVQLGYYIEFTSATGRSLAISRDAIPFYSVSTNGYTGEFRVAIMPEHDAVVLARTEIKGGLKTWKFRVVKTATLSRVLRSTEATKLIAEWKMWLTGETAKVVKFTGKRAGDASSIVHKTAPRKMAATG